MNTTKTDIRCPHCHKLYGRTNLDVEVRDTMEGVAGHRHIEVKCECKRMYWVVSK